MTRSNLFANVFQFKKRFQICLSKRSSSNPAQAWAISRRLAGQPPPLRAQPEDNTPPPRPHRGRRGEHEGHQHAARVAPVQRAAMTLELDMPMLRSSPPAGRKLGRSMRGGKVSGGRRANLAPNVYIYPLIWIAINNCDTTMCIQAP
jgi:hypothetical protein